MEISFLGIDGAGKSTMSSLSKEYLESQGYNVTIIPFHKWVFADKLRTVFGNVVDRDRQNRTSPYSPQRKSFSSLIKPPVAFVDNLLFYLLNRPSKKNEIFLYDRFICATQIKFSALNYHVNWFKGLWWNIPPKNAIVFLLSIDESIRRQNRRNDPYAYTKNQLAKEYNLYLNLAKNYGYPVIYTDEECINTTFQKVQVILNRVVGL